MAIYFGIVAGMVISIADLIQTFVPMQIMFLIISTTYFLIVVHAVIDGKNYKVYQELKEGRA